MQRVTFSTLRSAKDSLETFPNFVEVPGWLRVLRATDFCKAQDSAPVGYVSSVCFVALEMNLCLQQI